MEIIEKGEKTGLTNVLPVGAVTKNMAGVEITDVEELKKAGICAISEDGKSVMNSGVYRKAMKNAFSLIIPSSTKMSITLSKFSDGLITRPFFINIVTFYLFL